MAESIAEVVIFSPQLKPFYTTRAKSPSLKMYLSVEAWIARVEDQIQILGLTWKTGFSFGRNFTEFCTKKK